MYYIICEVDFLSSLRTAKVLLLVNELFLPPPEFENDHFDEGPNVGTDDES